MREKRLRGIRDVRHFVQRQPELVVRQRSADGQIAGTHAHDMRECVAGQEDESGQGSHAGASGTAWTCPAARRCCRMRREMIRMKARTRTERNAPGTPASSAPAKTPNSTSSGSNWVPARINSGDKRESWKRRRWEET